MKLALSLIAGAVIAAGPTNNSPSFLLAADVFKRSREAYAALSSYSDEGTYFQNWAGADLTYNFLAKMSRPDLYRVSWVTQNGHKSVVWCAGGDDFISEYLFGPGTARDQEKALSESGKLGQERVKVLSKEMNLSFGIVTVVPGIFFDMLQPHARQSSEFNPLSAPSPDEKQLSDDKIGGVDCYVFVGSWKPQSNLTVWIGKSDYLIRQIKIVKPKDVGAANAQEKAEEDIRKENPDLNRFLPKPTFAPQDTVTMETHSNIVVNQKLSPSDFLQ